MPKTAHTYAHTLGINGKDSSGRKTDCECSQASLHQLIGVCVCVCVLGDKEEKQSIYSSCQNVETMNPLSTNVTQINNDA